MLTIDSYYLSAGLDYGVIGFLIFYALFMAGIWYAARNALDVDNHKTPDQLFFVPIAVALTNFVIIRAVFSQQDLFPMGFALLGMTVGLIAQTKTQPTSADSPLPIKRVVTVRSGLDSSKEARP